MPYDAQMTRALVAALSTEEVSRDLLASLENESLAMNSFRTVRMSKGQSRLPIIDTLPHAYFVNGDKGLKQTTEMKWDNKFLNVEELAVIIPIPEAVLDDSDYDIWGAVKPLAVDAAVRVFDNAVVFGVDKPASWPDAIAADAIFRGHVVTRGTSTIKNGGIAGDISAAFSKVEEDGYTVTGVAANTKYRGLLRNARNDGGTLLGEVNVNSAFGVDVKYPMRGLWPIQAPSPSSGVVEMVVGDFNEGIVGIRQDFTWKVLDQAALFDNAGNLILNLPQQDSIALRMVFRAAFQVANTIRYDNEDHDTRYPFAVVKSPDLS